MKSLDALLFINLLVLNMVGTVSTLAAYRPPPDQKVPPSDVKSDSATVRGCGTQNVALTILAPKLYVGQTSSTHPMFVWHVLAAAPVTVQFTLYRLGSDGSLQVLDDRFFSGGNGLMRVVPFQADQPGLQVGERYVWNVAVSCDRQNASADLFDRASFEVVPKTRSIQKSIAEALNSEQKANIYGEAGLWYDALEEALKLSPGLKLGKKGEALVNDLADSEQQLLEQTAFNSKGKEIQYRQKALKELVTTEK
jgi:Domain of Unknown Function (DUF928)